MAVVKVPVSRTIIGHKEVRQALRDTQTYSSDLQGDADVRDYRQLPLEVDPPRHHLYRAAVTPYFVRPTVEKHIPEFEAIADGLIGDFVAQASGDVVNDLALPLVMANLGVLYNRPQDVAEWVSWGPDVWTATGDKRDGSVLHAYLDRIYDEAIAGSQQDIWNELARLEIDGQQISPIEFRGIAGVMLAGGRDTVVKLLTGIFWHLTNNPEDRRALQDDPGLIDGALSEFLRFFTPLPEMARTTTPESTTTDLPADRYVSISFLSGNFDESVFDNPYVIDIRRERNPHLSFGFGPHTCLGNHVAEIEAKVFLQCLLTNEFSWSISDQSRIDFYEGAMMNVPREFHSLCI